MPEGERPEPGEGACCGGAPTRGLSPEAMRVLTDNRPRFLAALRSRLGSLDLAEDVLQEGFTRAVAQETPLRDERALVAWFRTTLRNVIVDRARRLDAAARAFERLAGGDEAPEIDDAPARPCRCVNRALDALAPAHQEVLRSVVLDGRAIADVANELGITPNHASVRLHRARAALEQEVRRRCGRCTVDECRDCTCDAKSDEAHPSDV